MTIATRLALAVAAPIAVLATAGQSASAGPPPAEPPSPDLNAVVPADFVTLTDDTGTITVGVPNSWTDVDTAPAGVDPWISAAPDFRAFVTTFDVPGVIFEAVPLTTDTATLARDTGYASVCANEEVVPYDDGVFVGSHLIDTGCGDDGTTAYHVIAANPANQAFTALLDVQITSPDEVPILDGILATFNVTPVVGSAGVPSNTAAPATQAAFPPPSGEVPVDWSSLVDDTGTIAIRVPSTWTDVDLFPLLGDDGTSQPTISATTDAVQFYPPDGAENTFSVPGAVYWAETYRADTAARLADSVYHDQCTADPVQTFDDGLFAGHIQFFDNCGGSASRIVRVAANPADAAFTLNLEVQLTGQPDDAATLDGLLSSFTMLGGELTSTTVTSPAPTTAIDSGDPFTVLRNSVLVALQDFLQDQLGLTTTDEQASCLLEHGGQLDPTDHAAVTSVLANCGVDLLDLPSG
jgi:hypothetical protein